MKFWWAFLIFITGMCAPAAIPSNPQRTVVIIPVRDDIMPPMVYLIRRGVKEAMEAKADLLLLDMDTNGGRVDATEEIMEIIDKFKGQTATYVNRKAFSAGAFIAVTTQKIYMAPQSVIGAAAPIMLAPGASSPQDMPSTMEVKITSALRALVTARAEKNGHNVQVVQAMIDKSRELKIDGEVLNEKGQILTLTDTQAAKKYGDPAKPLLSAGTVEDLDTLVKQLGFADAKRIRIEPTGAETLARWLTAISPLLLIIGIAGIYIEFKTPGFGLPGIIGIAAFALYFLGGYIAGLAGLEWIVVFIIGLILVIVDFFLFPGTLLLALLGVALMLAALIMGMADLYPSAPALPGAPRAPVWTTWTWDTFQRPIQTLTIAGIGSIVAIWILSRFLPHTAIYRTLVSQGASGAATEQALERKRASLEGRVGVAISPLRPGGKAQFGEDIVDVISQGDLLPKDTKVRVIGYSGIEAIVERATEN